MKIYELNTNFEYQYIKRTDSLEEIYLTTEESKSLLENWTPIKISFHEKDEYSKKKLIPNADCVSESPYFLILSKKAIEILRDLLEPNGEILPLEYNDDKRYFIFNCLNRVKAFDEKTDKTDLLGIHKGIYIEENINGHVVFKDNGIFKKIAPIFVTQEFVNRVLENNLKGFSFYHIWSDKAERVTPIHL